MYNIDGSNTSSGYQVTRYAKLDKSNVPLIFTFSEYLKLYCSVYFSHFPLLLCLQHTRVFFFSQYKDYCYYVIDNRI